MSDKLPEELTGFLTKVEKQRLQTLYEDWINQLNPDSFLPKLYSTNLVSEYDRQSIDAETTKNKKCSKIFHDTLMRSTYEDLSKIRDLLVDTRDKTHIALAKRFPDRGEPISFEPPSLDVSNRSSEKYTQECSDPRAKSMHGGEFAIGPDLGQMRFGDLDAMEIDDIAASAGKGFMSRFKSKPGEPVPKITSHYGFKSHNPESPVTSGTGRGLCVVIRNFSQDLPGYEKDAMAIRRFFQECLKFEVMEGDCTECRLVNICHDEFELALRAIVKKLSTGVYDRFFLFILSHGDTKGIKMSVAGNGLEEEPGKRYKVEDIIAKFTHDKIIEMKDYPKCFFIQACRGEKPAKNASLPNLPSTNIEVDSESYQPIPLPKMANGRDILVCYPTEEGYYSWVPGSGSWFIREAMSVLWKYYRSEHLLDMMVEAAGHISEINKPGCYSSADGTSTQDNVCQMPHYICTLTKKFYLHYPPDS